ncbi:MAG: hypothetical protein AAGF60_07410 [Pseudomonadota bacterium]
MIRRVGLVLGVALVGAAVLMSQSSSPEPEVPRIMLGIPVPGQPGDTDCTDPQVWTGQTPGTCLAQPRICPDGSAGCDGAPRLWTNMRRVDTGASHL